MTTPRSRTNRRDFLRTTAAATAALGLPTVLTAGKTESETIVGAGGHRYAIEHRFPQLPEKYHWQTTHNVAVDAANNLYVIHEGNAKLTDHPTIFVFAPDGRFLRAFGEQFAGGGHGIEVREENGDEFLYVCAYQNVKAFAKLTLDGKPIWTRYAPMESGLYAKGEATDPKKIWGRDRFMPTNFAFLDDGGFLLADGYGSFYIHRYDADANWKACFGGPGAGEGKFATPHGLWIDRRGDEPELVVCDRAHNTLQYLTLDGKYLRTQAGFGLPANLDTHGDLMLVPELVARVSLLGSDGEVVATLGADIDRLKADRGKKIRRTPSEWEAGKFVHPHDACFDREGNIFVAEWVSTGRVSRLRKLDA